MAKKSKVLPYGSIRDSEVRGYIDSIRGLRRSRAVRAVGAGTTGMIFLGTAHVTGRPEIISAGATAGLAAMIADAEHSIVDNTSRMGIALVQSKKMAKTVEAMARGGFTHAHMDGKGNLVFTRDAKRIGKVIVPKVLKPTTWRWRMKVPIPVIRRPATVDLKSARYRGRKPTALQILSGMARELKSHKYKKYYKKRGFHR